MDSARGDELGRISAQIVESWEQRLLRFRSGAELQIVNAFLSFGESSIAGMGKHPHGEGWLVGSSEGFLLSDAFISVSGLQNQGGPGEPALKAQFPDAQWQVD